MFICNVMFIVILVVILGLMGCFDSGGQIGKNVNFDYQINGSLIVKGMYFLFDLLNIEFVIFSDVLFGLSDVDDGIMLNGIDLVNLVIQGIGFLDGVFVFVFIDIKISVSFDSQ